MALTVDTGQVAANTGSATTTITVTAQGKAIILFTTGQTANGSDTAANASFSFGFSNGVSAGRCEAWAADDNVGTTNCASSHYVDRPLVIFSNGTPTVLRYITAVAFTNSTTTTLTWDGTPAAAYLVGYMQFGGSDITDVGMGGTTNPTSTGDNTVTGIGFQPDFGVFICNPLVSSGNTTRSNIGIGFAVSNSKQFSMCMGIDDAATMTATIDAVSYTNSAAFLSGITAGAETIDFLASFGTAGNPTGWNSDGFDYNVSNAATTGSFSYLLIKGGQWDVGTTTAPTSGARTITGMAFQPKGLLLANTRATADATVTINALSGIGAATSTSTETYGWSQQNDAVLNTTVDRSTGSDRIGVNNFSFPFSSQLDFSSFSSGGWEINETSTGTAVQLGWFAMGDNVVSAPLGKKVLPGLLARRRFGLVP